MNRTTRQMLAVLFLAGLATSMHPASADASSLYIRVVTGARWFKDFNTAEITGIGSGNVVGYDSEDVVIDIPFSLPVVHPMTLESCDGVDEDCDGQVDEFITACPTATVAGPPAQIETPPRVGDHDYVEPEIEQDLSADAGCIDADRDGAVDCVAAREMRDCDDTRADRHPGAIEACDGVDEDCDGDVDEFITSCATSTIPGPPPQVAEASADGLAVADISASGVDLAICTDRDRDNSCVCPGGFASNDCDDADGSRFPGAVESCDGVDEDCDGETDEYITNCETSSIPGPPAQLE